MITEHEDHYSDDNGNTSYFAYFGSKQKAKEALESLVNCKNCKNCSRCTDCSECFDCSECYRCSRCSDCYRCYGCSDCTGCTYCSECFDTKGNFEAPVIENIHQAVLAAVSAEGALDMDTWHTCETTHCRAGWVVHLAGEGGKKLEARTNTPFAAMQIYKASSSIRVSHARFYEDNEKAMEDIRRCAELEAGVKSMGDK